MAQCFHIGSICLKTAEALKGETASQPVFQNSFMTSKNFYTHSGFTVYELWLSWNLAQTSINAGSSNFVRLCLALAFYSQLWTLPYLSDHTLDRVIMRLIRTNDRVIYSRIQHSFRIQGSSIFSSTFAGAAGLSRSAMPSALLAPSRIHLSAANGPSLFRGVCFAKHANQNVGSH